MVTFRKFINKEITLFILLLVALLIIVARIALLNTQEIFPFGAEIGNILSALALGYIVSYIFYFLVVYLKIQNDKKNVSEFLVKYLSYLAIKAYSDFNKLKINSKVTKLTFPPNEEDLTLVFSKLHPVNSFCQKSSGKRYNWYYYYKFVIVEESNKYIEEIWKLLPYLDTELIKILNSLKESLLFRAACGISREVIPLDQSKINVQNDKSIPKRLAEYFSIINELEKYLSLNFNEYQTFSVQRKKELYRT